MQEGPQAREELWNRLPRYPLSFCLSFLSSANRGGRKGGEKWLGVELGEEIHSTVRGSWDRFKVIQHACIRERVRGREERERGREGERERGREGERKGGARWGLEGGRGIIPHRESIMRGSFSTPSGWEIKRERRESKMSTATARTSSSSSTRAVTLKFKIGGKIWPSKSGRASTRYLCVAIKKNKK